MAHEVCRCPCHHASLLDRARFDGADVTSAIEAAIACPLCRNDHCAALSSMRLANDPEPMPADFCAWTEPLPDATGDKGEGEE